MGKECAAWVSRRLWGGGNTSPLKTPAWEATSYTEEETFSNSLIIHQEKTKKITTVTAVWICDPNYHKILPTYSLEFLQELLII